MILLSVYNTASKSYAEASHASQRQLTSRRPSGCPQDFDAIGRNSQIRQTTRGLLRIPVLIGTRPPSLLVDLKGAPLPFYKGQKSSPNCINLTRLPHVGHGHGVLPPYVAHTSKIFRLEHFSSSRVRSALRNSQAQEVGPSIAFDHGLNFLSGNPG